MHRIGNGNLSLASLRLWDTRKSATRLLAPSSPDNATSRHPTEPQCSYDPVEGLPIAPNVEPTERIRMLEEQICECSCMRRRLKSRKAKKRPAPAQQPLDSNHNDNVHLAGSALPPPTPSAIGSEDLDSGTDKPQESTATQAKPHKKH